MALNDIRLRINLDGTQAARVLAQLNDSAAFKGLKASIATLGPALAASFVGAGLALAASVKSAIDRADELSKAAQKAGVGTDTISALAAAAELADVSLEDLGGAFNKLNKAAVDAATGGKAQIETFKALGVTVTDANGALKPSEQLLGDVADGLAKVQDGALRSALAQEVFGKSGANLLPLLKDGAAGLREAADEAAKFGLIISPETGIQAEAFNDNLGKMGQIAKGAGNDLAANLLPVLVELSDKLVGAADSAERLRTTNALSEFAENSLVGLVRVAEVVATLAKGVLAVGKSFQVVGSDLNVFDKKLGALLYFNKDQTQNDKLKAALDERRKILQDAGKAFDEFFSGDATKTSRELAESIDKRRAFVGPVGFAPPDEARSASAAAEALRKLNEERNKPTTQKAKTEGENKALDEQAKRLEFLAKLAEPDPAALSRSLSLAEGVLTPVEKFRQQLAEINRLVRDGDLARAAERIGVDATELQNRLVISIAPQAADEATEASKESISELTTFAEQGARNIQDAFAQFLFNPLEGGFKGLVSSFANTLAQIAAQAASSAILKSLFGSLAGSGGFAGAVGSAFGGVTTGPGRATGGPVYPGRIHPVNERGPELLSVGNRDYLLAGAAGGQVTPLAESAGRSGTTIMVNVDARQAQDPNATRAAVEQGVRVALAQVNLANRRGFAAGG